MSEQTTENLIKKAAHELFTEKGYAATRTRDIAERAGINLALLNYYFRSKENLFKIVMSEKISELFGAIIPILQSKKMSIMEKIDQIIDAYHQLLFENSDLPFFVLNEMRKSKNSDFLVFLKEIYQKIDVVGVIQNELNIKDAHQFLVNFIAMIVFPFISKPIMVYSGLIEEEMYEDVIKKQKVQIHKLIKSFQQQ